MPPGGTPPIPPYDSKAQWRAYREQQKAAARAQRDAWRAQRHAWKASYRSAYGPRIPSVVGPVLLITVGVIALLVAAGKIDAGNFCVWYGQWWPLLLIAGGVAMIVEWALDARRKTPVRRSHGFIVLLLLLAFLGLCATGWNHMRPFMNNWGGDEDSFNFFGLPEHDQDQQPIRQQISSGAAIEIDNPRGDVSITAADGNQIEVQAHEVAYASSDGGAGRIFDAEKVYMQQNGNMVQVQSNGSDHGKVNLTVMVPHNSYVRVNAGKGDVAASGLGAGVEVDSNHGDTRLDTIAGPVRIRSTGGKYDFSAHQIDGEIDMQGNFSDVTLSEMHRRVTINGQIYGEVHIENAGQPIRLHTSITDVQIDCLPGDMTMDKGDMRISEAKGPVHITTRSKDIELDQIDGDIFAEDRNGAIRVASIGTLARSVEIRNDKGDVELTLPANASATVSGKTHNGEIVSEFALPVSGDVDKTVSGKIGTGLSRIMLSTSNGDLHIKKGSESSAAPAPQNSPNAEKAKHLKSSNTAPQQPVSQ
jgi:hypothetical protein